MSMVATEDVIILGGLLGGKSPAGVMAADAEEAGAVAAELGTAERAAGTAGREGRDFTPKGRRTVIERNAAKNGGKTRCESCGVKTVPSKQSQRGVKPPRNETQVDHIKAKSKGGSGTPDNGQVLCRGCNRDKSNNEE